MHQLTRRTLLGMVGASAGAAVFGPAVTGHAESTGPSRRDWIDFARRVDGPVYLPGTAPYRRGKKLFDTRFDDRRPAAVLRVAAPSDVQRAMDFAARHQVKVCARGGGHSYIGASAANGTLVLDLRGHAGVTTDARTATVRAGTGLYAVHAALAPHGRTVPTGTCPTVGTAGLTLGGGIGVDSRRHGLTCDRVRAATVVLPDGTITTVSAGKHPDVFWALRGGGGGQVATVLDLTFATHPAKGRGIFSLTFPHRSAADVISGWSRWTEDSESTRWGGVHVNALGDGAISVTVLGVTDIGDERRAAADLARQIGTRPSDTAYRRLEHLAAIRYLGGGSTSKRTGFVAGSDVIRRPLHTTSAPEKIVAAVRQRSADGGTGAALLDPLDGRVASPSTDATAFPWRHHAASLQWYVGVPAQASWRSADQWVARAHRSVRGHSSGAYVNYLETDVAPSRYFGPNLDRLAQVRRTHDPHRLLYSGL